VINHLANFSDINISQSNVIMWLRCGGLFTCYFLANLLLTVLKVWNLVKYLKNVWQIS